MLVLSRKENETIEFPALGVVIRVFGLTRKRVQLGIEAPISLKISRGEKSATAHAPAPVESIAEYVIGEEFERLEAELATLAELCQANDRSMARKVAAEATQRITQIKRTVSASLRSHEETVSQQLRSDDAAPLPCVRQPTAEYVVDSSPVCV